MKQFMDKVVTERPRSGGRLKDVKGYSKKNKLNDESSNKEKIRQKWQSGWLGKEFTDRIGPLRRYLESQCGRKWNDVYSEICQILKKTSKQSIHIHEHISWFVETKVEIINNKPCHKSSSMTGLEIIGDFYVDPKTNILTKSPKSKRWRPNKNKNTDFIKINDTQFHIKINEIWYLIEVKPIFPRKETIFDFKLGRHLVKGSTYSFDVAFNRYIDEHDAKKIYGDFVIGIKKIQLNKRELKKAGLK